MNHFVSWRRQSGRSQSLEPRCLECYRHSEKRCGCDKGTAGSHPGDSMKRRSICEALGAAPRGVQRADEAFALGLDALLTGMRERLAARR